MYTFDYESWKREHTELVRQADAMRLAYAAHHSLSAHQPWTYRLGAVLVQWGQRLEHLNMSHATRPPISA
jgi:hypothetical protein